MRLLVYGSKDFSRVIRVLAADCGHEVVGCIDDFAAGPEILGTFAETRTVMPPAADLGVVIAIGYEHIPARWQVFERVREAGYQTPALVHPSALVHRLAQIGDGAFVMAGANIDLGATIGPLAVVWPGVIVSHESHVGANTFLSPGAILCGLVSVGEGAFVGAGAVVADHRTVPAGTFMRAAHLYK